MDDLRAAGVATACLSNTNAMHWVALNDPGRHPSMMALDARFASFQMGLSKPDPRAFRIVADAFPDADRRIFFDDNANNVVAAIQLGWEAHRVDADGDPPKLNATDPHPGGHPLSPAFDKTLRHRSSLPKLEGLLDFPPSGRGSPGREPDDGSAEKPGGTPWEARGSTLNDLSLAGVQRPTLANLDAVIFDIDGTLLDSNDANAYAWRKAFREFGKEVPQPDIRGAIGKGGDNLLPDFWSKEELERLEKPLGDRRSEIYRKELLPKLRAFTLARELGLRLRKDGRKVAVASSAKKEELEVSLKIVGFEDLVEAQTSTDDAPSSKPDPDIFLAALERLGNPDPAWVLVVGDTPYDVIAAKKAGMRAIAVLCGGFPRESLEEAGALAIFQSPSELLLRYEETPFA